eukprot:403372415
MLGQKQMNNNQDASIQSPLKLSQSELMKQILSQILESDKVLASQISKNSQKIVYLLQKKHQQQELDKQKNENIGDKSGNIDKAQLIEALKRMILDENIMSQDQLDEQIKENIEEENVYNQRCQNNQELSLSQIQHQVIQMSLNNQNSANISLPLTQNTILENIQESDPPQKSFHEHLQSLTSKPISTADFLFHLKLQQKQKQVQELVNPSPLSEYKSHSIPDLDDLIVQQNTLLKKLNNDKRRLLRNKNLTDKQKDKLIAPIEKQINNENGKLLVLKEARELKVPFYEKLPSKSREYEHFQNLSMVQKMKESVAQTVIKERQLLEQFTNDEVI